VPDIYPDRPIEVYAPRPVEVDIKGERFRVQGICEVPTYAAIFMIGRRMATLEVPADG
jgi:DNA primase small subunit